MNYFDLYSLYPDHTITAAWDCQMTEATQTPWLKELLLRRGTELFPRFAACYAELCVLPRSARRALQHQIARSSEPAAIFPEWLQSGGRRELQYKLARSLAGAALLLALWQGMASAATITVTTKDSRVRPDGQCSLIEAIVNANADAAFFSDCEPGSGPDTIVLPTKGNVSVRAQYDNTYGPTGLPLITSQITIEGNGGRIRGQGNAFRLFAVSNSGNLTLQNVNLSGGSSSYGGGVFNNGTLTIQNSTISGNRAGRGGGVSNHGTLTVENSTISGNNAGDGGGVSNGGFVFVESRPISHTTPPAGTYCFYYGGYYDQYGGVYPSGVSCFQLYSGALTITDSTISKNSATTGGGISNYAGTVTIANSTISGNKGSGGGAFNHGGSFDYYGKNIPAGDFSIANSTISKNSASLGGGVFNKGVFTIENSAISGNRATDDGGGIFNASNNNAPDGDLSLLDTTISENRAKDSGGGLFSEGSLTMSNTVISNNKARFGPDVFP
jgi:predicted outer membrane repeat protein